MEHTLHRQLKERYAGASAQTEVRVAGFRIDAVADGRLIEIQVGSLAALRRKLHVLLAEHHVRLVKPVMRNKYLVRLASEDGPVLGRRRSPKTGRLAHAFSELVFLTRLFPHPRLEIDVVLVDVEQWRMPGQGRRWRRRKRDHVVVDQRLLEVHEHVRLRTAADLEKLLPKGAIAAPFDTRLLAERADIPRHLAQQAAYCLRQMGAARVIGKTGNAWLYQRVGRVRSINRAA